MKYSYFLSCAFISITLTTQSMDRYVYINKATINRLKQRNMLITENTQDYNEIYDKQYKNKIWDNSNEQELLKINDVLDTLIKERNFLFFLKLNTLTMDQKNKFNQELSKKVTVASELPIQRLYNLVKSQIEYSKK